MCGFFYFQYLLHSPCHSSGYLPVLPNWSVQLDMASVKKKEVYFKLMEQRVSSGMFVKHICWNEKHHPVRARMSCSCRQCIFGVNHHCQKIPNPLEESTITCYTLLAHTSYMLIRYNKCTWMCFTYLLCSRLVSAPVLKQLIVSRVPSNYDILVHLVEGS